MRKCTTLGEAMQCAVAASGVVGSTVGARPDGVLLAGGGPSPMEVDKLHAMFAAMNARMTLAVRVGGFAGIVTRSVTWQRIALSLSVVDARDGTRVMHVRR